MSDSHDLMDTLAQARPTSLDPGPDPVRRERDLARIFAEPSGSNDSISPVSPIGPINPVSPIRLRRLITGGRLKGARGAGFGLAAAAGVVAVTLVLTNGGGATITPPSPSAAAPGVTSPGAGSGALTAADVLLVAARQVEAAPAGSGRYWLARTRYVGLERVGPPGNRYLLKTENRDDTWTARSASRTSWYIGQYLGAKPATAPDEAAWKKDGSPTSWIQSTSVAKATGLVTEKLKIDSAALPPFGNPSNSGASIYALGDHNVSMRDLQALPSDPKALKRLLLGYYRAGGAGGDLPSTQTPWLFQVASGLLDMPVTPKVRAAAYRLMAGLDGVRNLGTVSTVDGRAGNAVAVRQKDPFGLRQDEVIIDPSTGLPLGTQSVYLTAKGSRSWLTPKDVWYAQVVDSIGWTDATPPKVPEPGRR